MNKTLYRLIVFLFCLALSFAIVSKEDDKKIVSVIELIDNQTLYHGKSIRVKGYASMGFESCLLWPEGTQNAKVPSKYWVWYRLLGKGCGTGEYAKKYKSGPAIIEGVFNKNDKGHLGSYSASINNGKITWLLSLKK